MNNQYLTAIEKNLTSCLHCGDLVQISTELCHNCHSTVHFRKPNSLTRAWALLIASIICFFPANLLPVMKTTSILGTQSDTIMSGVIHLWEGGMYPIATVVFVASIVTPIFKMLAIAYLCYSCQKKSTKGVFFRSKLYHIAELIGRWSMIDVFVVALLGALVQMGALASIDPGPGIIAFMAVVVLTMLATDAFDPRLIWDTYNKENKKK